jgi:hypothetical protein
VKSRLVLSLALVASALAIPAAAQAAAPTVVTGAAKGVTFSGATLTGSVNPHGSETNYYFQYGRTTSYGTQTVLTPLGNGTKAVAVSAPVNDLLAGTQYHYRLIGLGGSTVHGADRTFTTPKVPLSLALVTSTGSNPLVFGSTMSVEGTLSGTGNAHREVDLQANTFPFSAGYVTIGNPELTNADGSFLFPSITLPASSFLRVVSPGKPTIISVSIGQGVAVAVTLHVAGTHRHHFARLFGSVAPSEPGAQIAFERLKPRAGFVTVGGTTTGPKSQFSKVLHVSPGVYRVLVLVHDGGHLLNRSQSVVIH